MKFMSKKVHEIIDILVCVFLLASPVIFGFPGTLALLTYALGVAYSVLAFVTSFKIIPIEVHEVFEFMIGVTSIILAYTLFDNNADGKLFYVIFGNCILLTWLVTDYKGVSVHSIAKL